MDQGSVADAFTAIDSIAWKVFIRRSTCGMFVFGHHSTKSVSDMYRGPSCRCGCAVYEDDDLWLTIVILRRLEASYRLSGADVQRRSWSLVVSS